MNPHVNILLVDDEHRNLDALESFLESSDYRLVRALTAERALALLLEGEFAVIVLDIHMPGMNGIELANLIKQRKRTQNIPIIFLTAYFQEEKDILEGYGIGAVDYLTKPVNPQILKSKISVFVDLFRKTRALTAINATLELEIAQRQTAENALRLMNTDLESRVATRTADLIRLNEELREREAALRASETQALAASRAKDDFLAALSHELRTPLNPVLLLATEAANDLQLPADIRGQFETIAKNVALEARLIDDLLDLTRISHGKVALELRPFDVHDCLQEALAMVRDEIDGKKVALTLALEAPRRMVRGDDVRLKQVFWNVVKNAAKFTPPGGQICVKTATADGEQVEIEVADSGIGMTRSELDRTFEAFAQGDHAVQNGPHRFGGIGMGLAISRMMVKLHAGSIRAFSQGRNCGTTITITLPLAPAAELVRAATNPATTPVFTSVPNQAAGRLRRVLLVEDHASTAQALAQLLRRRQYDVAVAHCVADARALSHRNQFDLLISDIGLPDGNGCELMAELRGRNGLVGIALTGYGMEDDVNRSQAAGFFAQLTKPVTVQALDRILAAAEAGAGAVPALLQQGV